MDTKAEQDALLAIENGVRLYRLALGGDSPIMPTRHTWAGPEHVDQVVARLGYFGILDLSHELQLGDNATRSRIRKAIKRGTVTEAPSKGQKLYR